MFVGKKKASVTERRGALKGRQNWGVGKSATVRRQRRGGSKFGYEKK